MVSKGLVGGCLVTVSGTPTWRFGPSEQFAAFEKYRQILRSGSGEVAGQHKTQSELFRREAMQAGEIWARATIRFGALRGAAASLLVWLVAAAGLYAMALR